jgi:Holliday junction resolvasome RuvABC ATP-dependent DNA helicase subunit
MTENKRRGFTRLETNTELPSSSLASTTKVFDALDRRYLAIVAERSVGIEAICAELAEDCSAIEDNIEPVLIPST